MFESSEDSYFPLLSLLFFGNVGSNSFLLLCLFPFVKTLEFLSTHGQHSFRTKRLEKTIEEKRLSYEELYPTGRLAEEEWKTEGEVREEEEEEDEGEGFDDDDDVIRFPSENIVRRPRRDLRTPSLGEVLLTPKAVFAVEEWNVNELVGKDWNSSDR